MTSASADWVASHTLALLYQHRAILHFQGEVFHIFQYSDRFILKFDPAAVIQSRIDDRFAHELSTRLQGRRVVRSNSRGLYLQVGLTIPPHVELNSVRLDLAKQPGPWSLPLGVTERGELWLDLVEGDSFLLGGTRGFGKSAILHGWIQALVAGGQTLIHVWDGKGGVEFGRYRDRPNVTILDDLRTGLIELQKLTHLRKTLLLRSGKPNITLYNQTVAPVDMLLPVALFVDEATLVSEDARDLLMKIVERERAVGIYPILATNHPEAAKVLCKTNLGTRICLVVPQHYDSQMVLGRSGAQALPKIIGRGLVEHGARMVEFQTFKIEIPDATIIQEYTLSGAEKAIIEHALENDGRMTITLVNDWMGNLGEWQARRLLTEWENRGWIEKRASDDRARFVAEALKVVYEAQTQMAQIEPMDTDGANGGENA